MSGLCGWFAPAGATSIEARAIEQMTSTLSRFDHGEARFASARFGAVGISATAGDYADLFTEGERIVGVWGRASFDESGARSGTNPVGAAEIAQGFARKGSDVLSLLTGSFAIAILDGQSGGALLAIDRMGTRPLGYRAKESALFFGSSFDSIDVVSGPSKIDHQALFDYVYHHMVPAPASIHAGARRLQPGECVAYRGGIATPRRFWQMHFVETETRTVVDMKDEFLHVVRDSVRRAATGGSVGAFLSGGTDSSTIAGFLGEVSGAPARTYSIGFDAAGYDEMNYARIASRHFRTLHHEYYVTPEDVVAAIPLIAAVHDQPFGNSSAVPAYYCAKLAREDGIDTMLGGDGGDELFGGNERYAKQHLYSLYSDLPAGLRTKLIEPVAFALPSLGMIGKAQRYMKSAVQPMPARYENYNLLERLGTAKVFTAEFLDTVDVEGPRTAMAQIYHAADARSLINRMLALDFKYTLADNDLPKVSRSCELGGIGARYPLLDDAVVAFSSRLSPRMKLNGTKLRYFFKEALRGFLPDAIIAKSKHGFGLPFGAWLNTHAALRDIAMDSLSDLKKRRIVRPEFIDELASEHMRVHAGYYGTMVWVLMMLEQWFRHHHGTGLSDVRSAGISGTGVRGAACIGRPD